MEKTRNNVWCIFIAVFYWSLISSLAESVIDSSCKCEENTPPGKAFTFTVMSSWSACEDWAQHETIEVGCYSGIQRRMLKCQYKNIDGAPETPEIRKLNARSEMCTESRRCLTQGRICEGFWGQWTNDSPCNCVSRKKVQTRYCNKRSQDRTVENKDLSIHCPGSDGHFEQNRTIACGIRDCPRLTEKSTTTTTTIQNSLDSSPRTTTLPVAPIETTSTKAASDTTSAEEKAEEIDSYLTTQTFIVAGAAAAVAIFAIIMLIAVCCMRQNQHNDRSGNKKIENNNNSQVSHIIPPPLPSSNGFSRPGSISNHQQQLYDGAIPNSLYVPYVDSNGDEYNVPQPGYSTQPSPARRALTARLGQNPWRPIPKIAYRDRSATVSALHQEYDTTLRDRPVHRPSGYPRSITLLRPTRESAYEVPIDGVDDDPEIYWSIEDTEALKTYQSGSQPNVSIYNQF
ncbi:uncharacterized protein LOC120327929 [Styela clava]